MLQHPQHPINPIKCRDIYSATSNNMKLVHMVQREVDWAGPQPTNAPPRCTKCNSPPINGQRTNHCIAVYNGFNVPIKG